MFRIDNSTAAASLPAPSPAGTPGYFTGGNPSTGIAPTIVDPHFLNMVQEEIMSVLAAASITPDKADYTQLLQAIAAIANGSYGTASTTSAGIVQLATLTEMLAGTVANRAATPDIIARAVQNGAFHFAEAAGTANALTAALTPAPSALVAGMTIVIKAAADNTGAATLNLNGIGAAAIKANGGDLLAGNLVAGRVYAMSWDGTAWQMVSPVSTPTGLVLLEPAGYVIWPNGLIERWFQDRTFRTSEGNYTFSFATAFPNACIGVQATTVNGIASLTRNAIWQINSYNASGVTLFLQDPGSGGGGNGGFDLRAIGK